MRLSTNLLAALSLIVVLQSMQMGSSAALAQSSQTDQSSPANTAGSAAADKDVAATASVKKGSKARRAKMRKPGDDYEGSRSLNMFQVEPSVINERYYTSGQAEHHQKISPTLPFGAPIPDNEGPYAPSATPGSAPSSSGNGSGTKPQTTSSADIDNEKLDSQVIDRLDSLQAIKNDSPALKLKLRVSTIDSDLTAHLKALKVDVISTAPASGDLIVYAPARNVSDLGHLKDVLSVVLAQ